MVVSTEVVARRYEDVSAGTPISVDFPVYEAGDVFVYYGLASLVAVQGVDYTIALAGDFEAFTVTPTASLLTKINALIAADATEVNYITVRRTLGFTTDATPDGVRYTPFTSREFDRNAMRDMQLADERNRSVRLSEKFVPPYPELTIADWNEGEALVFGPNGELLGAPVGEADIALSVAAAQAAEVGAVNAKIAAEIIETNVEEALLETLTARDGAQTAETGAVTARGLADVARDLSETYAGIVSRAASAAGLTDPTTLTLDDFGYVSGSGDDAVDGLYEVQDDTGNVWVRVGDTGLAGKASVERVNNLERQTLNVLSLSENLFNKNDPGVSALGFRINPADGAVVAVDNWQATHFIDLSDEDDHFVTQANNGNFAFYDASNTFVSGGTRTAASGGSVYTKPAGASKLRYSLHVSAGANINLSYCVAGDQPLDAFVDWGGRLNPGAVKNLGSDALENGAVTPLKTSFVLPGKNLYDPASATVGQYIAANGTTTVNAAYVVSDFIPVIGGQTYICNRSIRFRAAYAADGSVLPSSGSNDNLASATPWTLDANVAFVRLSITPLSNATSVQFEQGSEVTGFQEFGFDLAPNVRSAAGATVSTWADKTVAFLGDSLTSQREWIAPSLASLGFIENNFGAGGTRISGDFAQSIWQDVRIDAIATSVDAVVLLGGTNDWANDVAIGTIADTDATASFYGALNVIADKLKARFPTKRIFWGTVPLSAMTLPRAGFTDTYTNSQGTIDAYNDAVRAVARRESFPLIDFYRDAGFHTGNLTDFMRNDGNRIHPNTEGGKRMGSVLIGRFNALQPIN